MKKFPNKVSIKLFFGKKEIVLDSVIDLNEVDGWDGEELTELHWKQAPHAYKPEKDSQLDKEEE